MRVLEWCLEFRRARWAWCGTALVPGAVFAQFTCDVRFLESPQPDARSSYALAYDNIRDGVLLFGGINQVNGRATFGDFWRWHDGRWCAIAQGALRPPPRSLASMAFDRQRGRVVLYGGFSELNTTLSDVWEWDGSAWADVTPATSPARRRCAIAYDEIRRRVVVFGGASGAGATRETRTWDGTQWTLVSNTGPSPRQGAAMAFDSRRGVIVLFGGLFGTAGFPNDTWEWDGAQWTPRSTGASPPGRHSHALTFDRFRQRIVAFGGTGVGNAELADTWEYNGNEWTSQPVEGPAARTLISAAFDEEARRTLVFGGFSVANPDSYYSGTWLWDGDRWTNSGARVVPSHRVYPAVAYDSARGVTVVVGGRGPSGLLNDTWEWNGTAWSQKSTLPGQRPGIVERAAMCFDSRRNVVVHFGGQNDTLLSGETWEWNGIQWSLRSQVGPSPRRAHAMAYDPIRQRVVLYGGEDASGRTSQTWEWNGQTWELRAPVGLGARVHSAMTFDPSRGQVVLFGGYIETTGYGNDLWAWNGTTWLPVPITDGPLAGRDEHGLYYDTARGRLVVTGGLIADNQPSNDAWELVGTVWTPIADSPPTPRFGAGVVFDELRAHALVIAGADTDRILDQVWTMSSGAPAIVRGPSSGRSLGGDPFEAHVHVHSDSPLTYSWRRNGTPLADGGTISGSHSFMLRINPAAATDSASYDVLVTNACGTTRSLVADIQIICPADLDDGTGTGHPDGGVTIEDLLYYLYIFDLGTPPADLDDGSGTGRPDGGVTIEDLLYFLQRYEGGC